MKKKKTIVVISIVVFLFVSVFVISNSDIRHVIFSSERIRAYELSAMRATRGDDVVSTIFSNGNIEIAFPLPNGAVPFENSEYPIHEGRRQYLITTEAFGYFLEELLPQNGYEYEQQGAFFFISKEDSSMQVEMVINMFTREFMRIELWNN